MSELQNLLTKNEGNNIGSNTNNDNNESTINSSSSKSLLNSESNESKIKQQQNKPINGDTKQIKKFMGPMFEDLERAMSEQIKQLDKLEEDLFGAEKKQKSDILIAHIPEAIRESKSIETIMKSLEDLIINSNESEINDKVDPSQKKNQESLQEKFNKLQENTHEKTTDNDNNKIKPDQQFDFNSIKLSNLVCMTQSLSAFLITKNSKKGSEKLRNITIKIYDAVNLWLSRLFRFNDSSVLFHDQEPEGFIRMCQIMLNCKYNEYRVNGYQVVNRQPAIYISAASKYSQIEYRELISVQIGLPVSSIRVVQISKLIDSNLDKIDISLFCKQIENDIADGFMPMILAANAGSYAIGQCDDLNQLNQISYKYKMWIHLEGVYLSTLVLNSVPTEIQHVASGDSITINLGDWLGLPSLSYLTLYKNVKNSNLYLQPFNSVVSTLQKSLPYWCVFQALGHQGVIDKIKRCTDMTYYMGEIVKKQKPYLKILDFKSLVQETHVKINSLGDFFSKALNLLTFVDLKNPIIVFKCDLNYVKERLFLFGDVNDSKPIVKKTESIKDSFIKMMQEPESDLLYSNKFLEKNAKTDPIEKVKIEIDPEIKDYTDTLTTWLCDLMNSLHKKIELELIEIENEGICIRYSPLEHTNVYETNEYDMKKFDKSMEDIISILDASIKCKSTFAKEISEFKNLIPVNIPKWAGIGAVRYIPDYLLNKSEIIAKYLEHLKEKEFSTSITESTDSALDTDTDTSKSEFEHESHKVNNSTKQDESLMFDEKLKKQLNQDIKEINEINEQLVKNLQAQDGAFSTGQAYDGLKAVKFGMVSELAALKKLADQVQKVGKVVEEDSRYIEKMAELIRIGIEKANEDLKKENEAKLSQQSLLRQIPYLNDVLNWWGPTETNVTGRSFNLQSGEIKSTEVTYKYHMQVEENGEKENEPKTSIAELNLRRSSNTSSQSNLNEKLNT